MRKLVTIATVMFFLVMSSSAFAGTQAGDMEIGAQLQLQNQSSDGNDSNQTFALGKLGWFVTDSLLLSVSSTVMYFDSGDDDMSAYSMAFEPNYHFNTKGNVVPYAGIHGGFTTIEYGNYDSTEFSYGAQGGLKFFVLENASLDGQIRYNTYETDGNSTDTTSLIIGFNVYF